MPRKEKLSLEGRIALITGASRGIGAAVAKRLASEGAHVILLARTVGGLEEVDDAIQQEGKGKATLVPLDLRDGAKIDGLAVQLAERFGKLDILVGNAGVLGGLRPITHVTDTIWKQVMTVNVEANFRLLRVCDGLLKQSDAGRAIFVTSNVTQDVNPYWGPYYVSKVALEAMVKTYAAENAKSPIRANLVDPGEVATAMHAEAMPGQDPKLLATPESVTDIFVKLSQPTLKETGEVFAA